MLSFFFYLYTNPLLHNRLQDDLNAMRP